MPTWEAANVAPRKKAQNKGVERNTETVEAALNRLSKAYSAAMECVGAWHRADSVSSKNNTDTIVLLKSLQQVGQAARSTFEKAILLDPLVATHAPLFTRVLRAWALDGTDSQKQRWAVIVLQRRSHPPSLSSAGHKSTVSKLSYLSLVNYADLLLAGCSCRGAAASLPATAAHNNNTVLDRGVVRCLRVLACSKSPCCCWNEHDKVGCSGNKSDNDDDNDDANDTQSDEVEQDTVRLAVTALIDASALDGSDPILWLKLACAARRLGRLQAKDNNLFPATLLSYRRLEKHALERARTCLPPNVPPNRTVVRAMQEWSGEEDAIVEFPQLLAPASQLEPETLTLELPRYSWSVLGRMLLRACRDGSAYSSDRNQRVQQRSKLGSSFASPVVSLRLSPMLTLPFSVLGAICQFLEPSSLMRLEATCRALSGAIISARAIMDHAALVKEEDEKKAQSLKWRDAATAQQQSQARGASNSRDDPMGEDSERNAAQTNRASKRVRSQIITSGKRAGRSARRSSTEYCLLAATLGCTADDEPFKGALETAIKWNQSFYCGRDANGPSPVRRGSMGPLPTRRGSMGKTPQHREEALERLSESALSVFVKRWSSCRSPPMGILFGFVSHVSLHVGSVYSADPGGSMVLTTCLVECECFVFRFGGCLYVFFSHSCSTYQLGFDLMIRRTRTDDILTPSWSAFGFSLPSNTVQSPTELFAIDLLHVELRFKSCERHELTDTDYDADVSIVFSMVPWLLSKLEEMNEGLAGSTKADTWLHLKARCFWLAAGFYLWMGRRCQNVSESREAETAGLGFVEDTLACLRLLIHRSVCLVRTPHLVSPGRTGPHWKELTVDYVTVFRNEIQAASVVLLAQEQFLEASSKVAGTTEESVLREEDRDALFAIGLALLERYTPSTDSPDAKHLELIDDFLSAYGDGLLSLPMTAEEDSSDTFGAKFDKLVPTGCVLAQDLLGLANPCILTILVTCLNMKSDKRTTVIQLLSRLVRALAGIGVDTEQPRRTLTEDDLDADQSDSDDESLMSDDESDESSRILRRTTDRMRYRQYGRLVQLLIGKIHSIFKEEMTADEKSTFALSDDCRGMLSASMGFSADLFQRSTGYKAKKESEQVEDLQVYLSIQTFVWTLRDCCGTADEPENGIARLYLTGLIRIIVQQRLILSTLVKGKSDSVSRSFLSQLKKRRSDFIAAVCCDLGLLLSNDCVHIDDGIVKRSGLFDEPEAGGEGGGEKLVVLCESLLWLWGAANGSELSTASGAGPDEVSGRKSAPTLDRPSRVRLQVPVAVALSGVCGSAVATKNSGSWSGTVEGVSSGPVGESVSLAEFYDSDTSAMDWLADAGDDETESAETRREELLRVISQAVYSIKHIVGSITEDDMSSYSFYNEYMTVDGPLLPLVASRVLNTFASSLLIGFVPDDFEEDARMHLWSDYAFGTRTTGVLLDSVLHKVYKNLHGFTLVSTHDGRDTSGGGPITGDGSKMKRFLPEHPAAGASLYRCIMRAYSHGRKSPPKASLETVLASLPPPAESENTTQIRKYLFANSGDQFELKDLVSLVSKDSNWEAHFSTMNGWDWDNIQSKPDNAVAEDEAAVVRKGIASLLAQGPLPTFQDAGSESDARESTLHTEEEFSKKFSAIVDDLCLGNTADCESWHKAAQCLTAKADLVADRLGLSKGFSRSRDFFVAERQSLPEASLGLTELLSEQERETQLVSEGWVNCLGDDLSVFVRHNWSSFQSLQSCSTEVGDAYAEVLPHDDDNGSAFKAQVWREIESLYNKKDFVGWQQAWGGLFVSTLRAISVRCMCLGIYILYKKNEQSTEASLLVSEISEFLGVTLYSQLMGSQVYGYPLRVLTDQQKREFAEASLVCFERALDASLSPDEQKSDNGQITWDLHFMIGKVRSDGPVAASPHVP